MKIKCIKSIIGIFTEGKIYECTQINEFEINTIITFVTDDTGAEYHIVSEDFLQEDDWFCEHFELLK